MEKKCYEFCINRWSEPVQYIHETKSYLPKKRITFQRLLQFFEQKDEQT